MTHIPLILGSSSKARQGILKANGIEFLVLVPNIDEKKICPHLINDPSSYSLAVANAKLDKVIEMHKELKMEPALLVTSDQVVSWQGTVREKPSSIEECQSYLKGYALAPAETHSSVAIFNTLNGKRACGTDCAKQYFKEIPEHIIQSLIGKGDVMYCCGGFMIDDDLLTPYLGDRIGDADSIIGLPMRLTRSLISQVTDLSETE